MRAVIFSAAIVAAAIVFMVIYQGNKPILTTAEILMIDKTRNAQQIETGEWAEKAIEPVNRYGGYIGAIVLSGKPTPVELETTEIKRPEDTDEGTLDYRYKKYFAGIVESIDQTAPHEPEVSYEDGFKYGARMFGGDAGSACAVKKLIVIGSGIPTEGEYIDFTDENIFKIITTPNGGSMPTEGGSVGATGAEMIEDLIAQMEKAGAIPDLTGVEVDWYGMTELTAEPQMEIPSSVSIQIKALWTAYLQAANADFDPEKNIKSYVPGSTKRAPDAYPLVTPILFTPDEFEGPITFPDSKVTFVANSPSFVDAAVANTVLAEYAPAMIRSEKKYLIVGTTASGEDAQFCADLSEGRAAAFANALIVLGVDPQNIEVCGGGYWTPFYISDRTADGNFVMKTVIQNNGIQGNLDEARARKNRTVIIMPYDCAQAQEILAVFSTRTADEKGGF
jgi:outer membrane protein OmpA-like peptidoglycan-associated protein